MKLRPLLSTVFASTCLLSAVPAALAQQERPQRDQAQDNSAIPPALRAAIASGNAQAVTQVIQTLSAGNPQRTAALAALAVAAAERMVVTNPQAAIAVAGAAVAVVSSTPVYASAPDQTSTILTVAARIMVRPEVQRIAPEAVANLSVAVVTLASTPQVYQASPQAAVQVMANAYAAANSPVVAASSPQVVSSVAQALNNASTSTQLNQANATNSAQIAAILAGQNTGNQNQGPTQRVERERPQSPEFPVESEQNNTTSPN